jgi:outer membrane biosynthesis protein TonB
LSSTGSSDAPVASAIPERTRLTLALLLSLLIHALLLSLIFGGGGWLPGFLFPWQDRRIEEPDLRVVVVPAQVPAAAPAAAPVAEALQQESVEQPVASGPALTPPTSGASTPRRAATAIVPKVNLRTESTPKAETTPKAAPNPEAKPDTDAATPPTTPLRADRPGDTAPPPIAMPPVIALTRPDEATWAVPITPMMPAPVFAQAPSISSPSAAMPSPPDAGEGARARVEKQPLERPIELAKLQPSKQEWQRLEEKLEEIRQDAARQVAAGAENARRAAEGQETARQAADLQETARQEAAKVEATKVEAAKVEATKVEATKVEATKVEAAKVEAAKVEAAKVEAAKVEAAKVEAARVEAAKVEAARVEAARVEAARVEAARVEAANAEAANAEAAKIEAARVEAAQVAAERLEAARRAIGRQLDEEAARRDAAARLSPSSSSARRYRLFGRTDPNAELILYAEAWARKIQLNMTFDMVREPAKQRHADPLVTVAIRRDGSVESVTFVQSSGVTAIDDAIRRIVYSQAPYQVFPPALASEYDVIEIRRTWYFDVAIRLY